MLLVVASQAGRLLVIDNPQHSDAIVVLEGDAYQRPRKALAMLNAGFAPRIYLDAQADDILYQWTEADLARRWVATLAPATATRIRVVAEDVDSTKAEAHFLAPILRRDAVHSVLIVTSEFHTRRALAEFSSELPSIKFSVAAAPDPNAFGVRWWEQREWAKNAAREWMSFLWWEAVDRWR